MTNLNWVGHLKLRPFAIVCIAVVMIVGAAGILLALRWPFTEARVTKSLEEDLPSSVKITDFHSRFFPRPGCDAEGVTFTKSSAHRGDAPLVSVRKIVIRGRYTDLLLRPGYIAKIALEELHVSIPARDSSAKSAGNSGKNSSTSPKTSKGSHVGEIVANGSILEIARANGKSPLKFQIHTLTVNSVGRDSRMTYRVSMQNAEPKGEIHSTGTFGPWNSGDASKTPVSGSYTFEQADLSAFKGIAGILSSEDGFVGVLGAIHVQGALKIPNFQLARSSHKVRVETQFQAIVNAINGDVRLENLRAALPGAVILAQANIAGASNHKGKAVSVDFKVERGRIETVLQLFQAAPRAPIMGLTSFEGRAMVMPEGRPFLKEATLQGSFEIRDGSFSNETTQSKVDGLSHRARGRKKNETIEQVTANLQGHVVLQNGVATFDKVSFDVPGALAQMQGTYNLINEAVDFHGAMKTDAPFAENTTGIKSVLLKPLNPLFKKHTGGAVIPVRMTGTYSAPQFGLDLPPKKNSAQNK